MLFVYINLNELFFPSWRNMYFWGHQILRKRDPPGTLKRYRKMQGNRTNHTFYNSSVTYRLQIIHLKRLFIGTRLVNAFLHLSGFDEAKTINRNKRTFDHSTLQYILTLSQTQKCWDRAISFWNEKTWSYACSEYKDSHPNDFPSPPSSNYKMFHLISYVDRFLTFGTLIEGCERQEI